MLNETWEDQYRRMLRSYELVRTMTEPIRKPREVDHRDVLYHFCCDAFHLRDWIQNSDLSEEIRQTVGTLFSWESSEALAACADIANGFKHLVLKSKPKSSGTHAEIVRRTTVIDKSAGHYVSTDIIKAGGKILHTRNLTDDAVRDWDWWLRERGILPERPKPTR
ncbi:hypothetical protein CIW52_12625 [Mycolicibacterium sp. P9-64]|uniref:hypothetical protein n=1 Tax=Mycolicibacterium sp. P9-64 TaxID=2024612 RepID=UPI0011EBFE50|nr:hypothetical protein [Mycolicibacterium sp. P9-64]KAA0083274.1 hypothetical protein CIW52_12625 [Mycolicibacterium sp. P9-64]